MNYKENIKEFIIFDKQAKIIFNCKKEKDYRYECSLKNHSKRNKIFIGDSIIMKETNFDFVDSIFNKSLNICLYNWFLKEYKILKCDHHKILLIEKIYKINI